MRVMTKKRIHIILATTLSAALLWVSVNMSYEYLITTSMPLVIEHLPVDKAIASPFPKAVQVKLRGNGWRSAAFMIGADPLCRIDLNSLESDRRVLTLGDIVDRITMPHGIQAVDMKPESIFIAFDRYAQRRVPAVLNAAIVFRSGYGQVGPVMISPESITVGGAASLLSTISSWPTAHATFADITSSLDAEIILADSTSHYLTLSPRAVRVRIDVQQFAEKPITGLPVAILAVPPNKEVILIPPKMDIVVRGGIEQLAVLTNDSFRASVDYGTILSDSTGYTDAMIVLPAGVQLVSKRPDRMQFIVRTRL